MSEHTLEGLPNEIIAEILHCFNSFEDLRDVIYASRVFFLVFSTYPDSTLKRIAENILLRADVWEAATAVLIHQRNGFLPGLNADYDGIKEELSKGFKLERADIPNIVANQRFFEDCARYFMLVDPSYESPALVCGESLSMKYFYEAWLLGLRFGYEDIKTFASRSFLSPQALKDLQTLSRLMIRSKYYDYRIFPPRWIDYPFPPFCPMEMFWQVTDQLYRSTIEFRPIDSSTHLLGLKMSSHLIAAAAMTAPERPAEQLVMRLRNFDNDWLNSHMGLQTLIDRYDLSCGWE